MTKYPATGPFSPTGPGISSGFLNNVEQWLEYAADSNVTTDGNGNITVNSVTYFRGQITQFVLFGGLGTQNNVSHGCTKIPSIFVSYTPAGGGSFGGEPSVIPHAANVNSSTCTIVAQTGDNWIALAIVTS